MNGFLFIDKPAGPTSHDLVDRVRRIALTRRVGHAGTLDPFATGLLILGVGAATKSLAALVGLDKTYEAVFVLGATSDTDDRTGRIAPHMDAQPPTVEALRQAMKALTGPIEQIPPAYSAIKIGGKKMYEAARAGKPLEAKPRQVTIYAFDLIDFAWPRLTVRIHCSSGTYIRALARDLGGYVDELRRTRIGPFSVAEAADLKTLTTETIAGSVLPVQDILSKIPPSGTMTT